MELHSPSSSPAHTSRRFSSGRSSSEPPLGCGSCSTKSTSQSGQCLNPERYSALHWGQNIRALSLLQSENEAEGRGLLLAPRSREILRSVSAVSRHTGPGDFGYGWVAWLG